MEFVIGGVSALMDARFAAAAGTERVVLNPWVNQETSNRGTDLHANATRDPESTQEEILKQALAVWNEIKTWVSGPEIWLSVPWPYLPLALEAFDTFDDCCGILVTAVQSAAPTVLQDPPFEIPQRIPYAVNYTPVTPGITNTWTAQHSPDWVVIAPDSIQTMPLNSDSLRYIRVETLDEVITMHIRQGIPPVAGIYLQADTAEATDYEVWQAIIDRICL